MAIAVFHPAVAGERTLAAGSVPVACRRSLNSLTATGVDTLSRCLTVPQVRRRYFRLSSVAVGLLSLFRFLATEVISGYIAVGYASRTSDRCRDGADWRRMNPVSCSPRLCRG
jgi:hypothetical protein